MPATCQFVSYKPRKGDLGYDSKQPRYMGMLAPCGAEAWVDDLCRHHGVIMLCTEDALSVRVVSAQSGNAYELAVMREKGRIGGQNGKRSGRAKNGR